MAFTRKKLAATLLAGTTLGGVGAGFFVQSERELDKFIAQALAASHTAEREATSRTMIPFIRDMQKLEARQYQLRAELTAKKDTPAVRAYNEDMRHMMARLETLYKGRDINRDAARIQAQIYKAQEALGVKASITATYPANPVPNMGVGHEDATSSTLTIKVNTGMLDQLSSLQREFVIDHEVAHVAHGDHLGANGKRRTHEEMEALSKPSLKRAGMESKADAAAIRLTCDPVTATEGIAIIAAVRRGITPDTLRKQLEQSAELTTGNVKRILKEKSKSFAVEISGKLPENTHPDFRDRVRALREAADKSCPKLG